MPSVHHLKIMQDSLMKTTDPCLSGDDSSLMSPPLTPTETYQSIAKLPWQRSRHSSSNGDHYAVSPSSSSPSSSPSFRKRKSKKFIQTYADMVHFLKPPKDADRRGLATDRRPNYERAFMLNVFEALEAGYIHHQRTEIDGGAENKDCTMLDKDVVQPDKKRKQPMSSRPVSADTKKKRRVSTAKIISTIATERRSSEALPRKEKVDTAAVYDTVDIDRDDPSQYPPNWYPQPTALDQIPVKVFWKGAPLSIDHLPYYQRLHSVEATIASTLRLSPIQYLRCKRTLILAAYEYSHQNVAFRKSDAQKLNRVDVNKTSALWTAFGELGWLGPNWPN
ncbi:uncharacterized protein BYT42DRAFT_555430 [Radiomyces spectabilis]|uniref:uncharacterized protein n=1 Tax=Radiomyces spectabilis TaxID=64574 RepID=UPI002220506C|nr:uncharacterized protein BYT42DRAFT_555430 [Radiomyces spectabilis]KAI8391058.1 hypothetical protein BYT42DRAFT_555430 [Radiomyces spectabilis]